ncbi:DMT family transporter [Azospirillum sp.]|uniref:DMT family transporter n=1 Tax=Azospirillum sp. TaxID=34012 RepID=UPI002D5ECFDA|nr:DMT family transporter [Azospirillum sp.]HYF88060.1 DMT family transporter [Azospirillum sp.]
MTTIASIAATPEGGRSRERRGLAYGLVAALIWGGYVAVSHHGIEAGLDPADLAFLRYSVTGIVLLPWLLRNQPASLAGLGWGRGMALALFAGPLFVLVGAAGFAFAPLAHSALIQLGTVSLMGIVLAALVVRERQSATRVAGLAVIVTGLAIAAGPGLLGGGSQVWKGDLLFASAGTMWAAFTVLQRRWQVSPLVATAAVSVLSGLIYSPLYLASRGLSTLSAADPQVLIQQGLVLGVLSGVVALFAFARAVEYIGPGRASLFPALAPAIAILAGIPISGVIPTTWQVLGLVVLSAGLLLAVRTAPASRTSKEEGTQAPSS